MNEKYFDTVFLDAVAANAFPESFAILTAFDPMDQILSQEENTKRNRHLLGILKSQGYYRGTIVGSSEDFTHQEPSLIAEAPKAKAIKLGLEFDQRAIFWINKDRLEIIECATGIAHCAGSFRKRMIKKKSCPSG
tara:strand:+ start:219 stop:623 length:405 start_codon:yes stop_codon:yes gene_type:complete